MSVSEQKILGILQKIGLSEKESAVYLAALQKGESTALELSRISGIKRATVYTVIDELKKRGIMGEVLKGLKKKFVAESPENLQQILDDNRELLHDHMPELLDMYSFPTTEQKVKTLEGAEGLRAGLDSMLSDIQVGDYYLVMANFETLHELLPKFMPKFLERRATYNIQIRTILQQGEKAQWYKDNEKRFNDTVKIFPDSVQFSANIVLTPHRLLIPQLLPYTGAVVIENKQVINTMKQLFGMTWNSVK